MTDFQTKFIRIDAEHISDALLLPAAQALRNGHLVAFPTETVYGIGANALDPVAVAAIFEVKGRPGDNPLIVHIASLADLPPLVRSIPPMAEQLFKAFSPGPLTLVMPKSPAVPDLVTAGLDTVAVRIPAHPVAKRLIELAGVPVAAPSANRSGRPSPTRAWHVELDLSGRIPYIIEAGNSELGLESTVVDVTGSVPVILRPGAITAAAIRDIAGAVAWPDSESGADQDIIPRSPGMKYRHYAPRARVVIAGEEDLAKRADQVGHLTAGLLSEGQRVGIFGCVGLLADLPETPVVLDENGYCTPGGAAEPIGNVFAITYGDRPDAAAAGTSLFNALRRLDQVNVAVIIAEGLPELGIGAAYMNRLRKAADAVRETGMNKKPNRRILFVCTGNTCRSPMAAALFEKMNTVSGWTADSAGVAAALGEPASALAITALQIEFNLDLSGHRSHPVSDEIMRQADWILTMTSNQRDILRQGWPDMADRILTAGEMAGQADAAIPDPFGRDLSVYEATAAALAGLIKKIIAKIN